MSHTLAFVLPSIERRAAARRTSLGWLTWACFIAAAGGAGVAMAGWPEPAGMATPREAPSAAERALLPLLPEGGGRARLRSRCEGCGVVEDIRRVEPEGALLPSYEFTIRLRDGSSRVSSDASMARWHIGDSIMLIGGAKPPVH
jgi:hypothetical protein